MSEDDLSDEGHEGEDWVPEDDAIIGHVFRRSLWVLAAIGLALAVVVLWPTSEAREENRDIETTAPEAVTAAAVPPEVEFADVTASSGIDFLHVNGAEGAKLLPETMGSGVAVFDFDGDGDQDLLFSNSTRWPDGAESSPIGRVALYENDGSGHFLDVSAALGVDVSLYGTGVAVGDYDGDGDRDVYLAAVGGNRLLRNEGGGSSFVDVTDEAGVGGSASEWTTSTGFLDIDNDGDLDLLAANYVRWSPEIDLQLDYRLTGIGRAYGPPANYEGTFLDLYRNEGDGTFREVAEELGLQVRNSATGGAVAKALGIAIVDLDSDGWIDFFVANDTVRNFLFMNDGGGAFLEQGEIQGVAYGRQGNATGAMGADAAHFRNDDDLGFLVANFANEMSSLYVSQGDPLLYADESIVEGLGAPSRRMLSFGVFFFDFDLDGRLDLLQANGHLEEEINSVDPSQTYRQATQLFWNAGAAGLVHVEPATTGHLRREIVGRGAAYGDLDGDGDLDVVVTQTAGPPAVFRNDQDTGHHYLRLRLVGNGTTSNRDAIGAWVELRSGGETQRRQVMPTRSYLSQMELPVTFGLGETTVVEELKITWPDGRIEVVAVDQVDREIVIEQGASG